MPTPSRHNEAHHSGRVVASSETELLSAGHPATPYTALEHPPELEEPLVMACVAHTGHSFSYAADSFEDAQVVERHLRHTDLHGLFDCPKTTRTSGLSRNRSVTSGRSVEPKREYCINPLRITSLNRRGATGLGIADHCVVDRMLVLL